MANRLIIDNKNKDEYKVIMKITLNDGEYVIYTSDEENKLGDKICYVGKYEVDEGMQKIIPIENIAVLENIDEIFRQVIMLLDKKESSDKREKTEK